MSIVVQSILPILGLLVEIECWSGQLGTFRVVDFLGSRWFQFEGWVEWFQRANEEVGYLRKGS